jgi:arsenate reductase
MRKTKVLFLCTGNSARSQMAEAFLRKYGDDWFEAYSAGLEPKDINPYTVRVMEEVGLSLDGHRSKPLTEYMGKVDFDYLITVCSDADEKCPFFPGMGQRVHWGLEDPAAFVGSEEDTLVKFREARDQIHGRVKGWLAELSVTE